jgi:hypothetical protein
MNAHGGLDAYDKKMLKSELCVCTHTHTLSRLASIYIRIISILRCVFTQNLHDSDTKTQAYTLHKHIYIYIYIYIHTRTRTHSLFLYADPHTGSLTHTNTHTHTHTHTTVRGAINQGRHRCAIETHPSKSTRGGSTATAATHPTWCTAAIHHSK